MAPVKLPSVVSRNQCRLPAGAGASESAELHRGWMTRMGTQLKLTLEAGDVGGVSLSDYAAANTDVAPLASPRSVYICLKEGIDPESLKFKAEGSFAAPGIPADLVTMSFEHHEAIRQDRLKSLIGQRDKVAAAKIAVPAFLSRGGKSASGAGMSSRSSSASMNDTLAAEKSALEVQRSAARSEKQKEKIEASAKEMQAIQFAATEKNEKNKVKQAGRVAAQEAAATNRIRETHEKSRAQEVEVRVMETKQRADAAEEFRVEEEVRQGLRLAERAAKKSRAEAERGKSEKEEAWRKQTAETRAAADEELRLKYEEQAAEDVKRTETLAKKRLAAADDIQEKKVKFEQKRAIALGKFEEQMKARTDEFEKNKAASEERTRRRVEKDGEEHARRVARGEEADLKRDKCALETEAKSEARRAKLLSEQDALKAQVVAFSQKSEKELTHKVMAKQLKALERIELGNARERSLAFKREVVRAELKEKMSRAGELKGQRARLAEEKRMANIRQSQVATAQRETMVTRTLKVQRDLFVDTQKRVNELAKTLATAPSLSASAPLPKV